MRVFEDEIRFTENTFYLCCDTVLDFEILCATLLAT